MSNGTKWYKNPLVIGIVTVILAFILSLSIYEPNFSISISPMEGDVKQGGSTQITAKIVNVNDIIAFFHPYKYPVKLSVSEPTGIVVTLNPSGEDTPPYTSTVIINVGYNALSGDHNIIIKGKGGDGKEHSTDYTLTVRQIVTSTSSITPTTPTTPTLTPTPTTPTPTPSGIVNIPLSAGWKVDESEAGGVGVEYKNGILELKARLQGNNSAQFSLDLRGVYIPEIERNSDGTYNLSGTELIAVVKSNRNFEGRLALFNKSWDFLKGPWLNRIDETNGQMFFKVPIDISYSKINAISFVFAIQPNETYEGSFFVQSLILKK